MCLKRILLSFAFLGVLISCKKYEPFTKDFDYTAVYFGTQKPLRTIVADDAMSFKVGVALAGVRENTKTETVDFVIDPTLLKTVPGTSGFQLLPENYYTLSDPGKMVISPGKLIGDITVTLNKELFTSDPNATTPYYALPLRIVSSTTDSVLKGSAVSPAKDYTIIIVKYISKYSGSYYRKGAQTNTSNNSTIVYSAPDLSKNQVWTLASVDANKVFTPGAGTNTTSTLRLAIDGSNNVVVSAGANLTSASGTGTFDPARKQFNLSYSYTTGGVTYNVKDTLIQRQPPEQELRFEEWQPLAGTPQHILDGFDLFWSDEFSGSSLDLKKWNYRQDGVVRNLGTVSKNNSYVNGHGQLLINVTKEADGTYYIGQIGTQDLFETTYGYFECRAKMNQSIGPHVAFWLQSPTYGVGDPAVVGAEIDIFEFHRKVPTNVYHNIHWGGYQTGHPTAGKVYNYPDVGTGYHVFGLEWNENEYVFYVDGVETWRTSAGLSKRSEYIILSAELTGWGGDPALGTFPDAVTFDYVRVYKKR